MSRPNQGAGSILFRRGDDHPPDGNFTLGFFLEIMRQGGDHAGQTNFVGTHCTCQRMLFIFSNNGEHIRLADISLITEADQA